MRNINGRYDVVAFSRDGGELAAALEDSSLAVLAVELDREADIHFESWPKVVAGSAADMLNREPDGKCLLERLDAAGCDSFRVLVNGDMLDADARERAGRDPLVYAIVPGSVADDIRREVNGAAAAANESYKLAAAFRKTFESEVHFREELENRRRRATTTRILTCRAM